MLVSVGARFWLNGVCCLIYQTTFSHFSQLTVLRCFTHYFRNPRVLKALVKLTHTTKLTWNSSSIMDFKVVSSWRTPGKCVRRPLWYNLKHLNKGNVDCQLSELGCSCVVYCILGFLMFFVARLWFCVWLEMTEEEPESQTGGALGHGRCVVGKYVVELTPSFLFCDLCPFMLGYKVQSNCFMFLFGQNTASSRTDLWFIHQSQTNL